MMNTQEWEVPKTLIKKLNAVSKSAKFVKRYMTDDEFNMLQNMTHSQLSYVSVPDENGGGWLNWNNTQLFFNINENGKRAIF